MKRCVLIGWCAVGLTLSCIGGQQLTQLLLQHVTFDIPPWLSSAVKSTMQTAYSNFEPDALDIQDACILLLSITSSLCIAIIFASVSVAVRLRYFAK